MILPPARTFFLIVLALVLHVTVEAESVLHEDPSAVTLPLEIEINGSSNGELVVRTDASLTIVEIEGTLLKEILADKVAANLQSFVDSLPEGFHTLDSYQALGLEIQLDLERLVIAVQIQEKSTYVDKGPQRISLGYQRTPNYDSHAKQATFSGFANLRFRSSYSAREGEESRSSNYLSLSHVLNLKGYALEGESLWNESDGFQIRELRLVKDFPSRLLRLSAGDISTPINELQRGFQVFGLNLAKEFGIQPYRTFTPTSSASFDLTEPSTVHVKINGAPARTLHLDPGSYNLEEFKLAAGPNNMELQIENDSGLVDQISVSEFGALSLLDDNVSTYSISYGYPRLSSSAQDAKTISSSSWYERYVEQEPVLSGYYKRGVTDQLTVTFDAQGTSDWNRLGVSAYTASQRWGSLNLGLSHNQTTAHPSSLSTRLNWSKNISGFQMSLSSLYTGSSYNLTRSDSSPSSISTKTSNSISASKLIFEKINVSANILLQSKYNGTRSTNTSVNIGRRLGKIYANLSFRQTRNDSQSNLSTMLTCTWSPAKKWRTRTQARYSRIKGATSIGTDIDYSNRRAEDYINARINAKQSDSGYDFGGSIVYQSGLYSASISHSQVYGAVEDYVNKGSQTDLTANSAIAFADGAFGFASRIRDSFAIIDKHSAWSDVRLGINPTLGGYEKENKSPILSAVIPDLSAYRESSTIVQTIDSDLFLDRNDYHFFPGYRRGTLLKLGNDAIYAVRGSLLYYDQEPVKYKAVRLTNSSGEKVDTFTNRVGRFMATGLKPGTYRVTVANTNESTEINIPKGEKMLFIDEIKLEK